MNKENTKEFRTVEIKVILPITFRWTCPDCLQEYLEIIHDYPISDQRVQCKQCGKIFKTSS